MAAVLVSIARRPALKPQAASRHSSAVDDTSCSPVAAEEAEVEGQEVEGGALAALVVPEVLLHVCERVGG